MRRSDKDKLEQESTCGKTAIDKTEYHNLDGGKK